jgi:arginyl-tRNA synthetase
MNYKEIFIEIICSILEDPNYSQKQISEMVLVPPNRDLGDLSFPCFQLAKTFKKSPTEISKELLTKISTNEIFTFTEVNGYFNAKIKEDYLIKNTILEVLEKEKNFGKTQIDDKQYVIDTFNANPLKTLHVGHLRNIVTGDFVSKILDFVGADPKPVSYGGDIGTHVARWYWYYSKLSDDEKKIPSENVSKWFGKIYIDSGKLLAENEVVYKKEIDDLQVKIMNDSSLQKEIKSLAIKSHQAYMDVGKELNISIIDSFFESDAEKKFFEIKEELFKNKDIFVESEGAIVADLKKDPPEHFILIKQNGAALYGAKDIGLLLLKKEKFPSCSDFLYVVASEQDHYFDYLFTLFKFIFPEINNYHISHGLVNTSEGKMKSREGGCFLYEDFRDDIFLKVKNKLIENGLETNESIIRDISFGVIKFEMLKTNLNKNIVFDVSAALDFQGDSAPYVQYSGVRAKSILKKSNFNEIVKEEINTDYSIEKEEVLLTLKINEFKEKVIFAYNGYKPQIITNYVLEIAHIFNKFYTTCPVLVENKNIKNTRLLLIKSFLTTLENALSLLGINIPDQM